MVVLLLQCGLAPPPSHGSSPDPLLPRAMFCLYWCCVFLVLQEAVTFRRAGQSRLFTVDLLFNHDKCPS